MSSRENEELLRWALPQLGMQWRGFRRVRGQVCKRIARRRSELGLADVADYRRWLETHPDEWARLDGLCRISITRFWRDRRVYEALRDKVLPVLAARARVRVLSIGCAGGEEPYGVVLAWRFGPSARLDAELDVVALDADPQALERARHARYAPATLREVPPDVVAQAFEREGQTLTLKDEHRAPIRWALGDVREALPVGPFDLVLCRNLAFTYFDDAQQRAVLERILSVLAPGGALVIGGHERLPETTRLASWGRAIWRVRTESR